MSRSIRLVSSPPPPPSDLDEDEATKWRIEPSEIEYGEIIGEGSFGKVWKGTCRGKQVAIKILDNEISDSVMDDFKHEVAVMA